jgi:hypothetical protein
MIKIAIGWIEYTKNGVECQSKNTTKVACFLWLKEWRRWGQASVK